MGVWGHAPPGKFYLLEHCCGSLQIVPPTQPVSLGCSWRSLAQTPALQTRSGSCCTQCTWPASQRCATMACEKLSISNLKRGKKVIIISLWIRFYAWRVSYVHVPVSALVYLLVMDHVMPMSKRSPFRILTCVLEIAYIIHKINAIALSPVFPTFICT